MNTTSTGGALAHQETTLSAMGEFAAGWPVVVGSNLGIAVGIAAIPLLSTGVFLRALQAEFGWSRTEISLGPTLVILVVALTSPLVGALADRVRTLWISTSGLIALAVALFLFSRLGPDIHIYYVACVSMGVMGSGSGTVPYAHAVSVSFVRARGLALGIAMVGTGVSATLIPAFLTPYVAQEGWRDGYVLLAAIVSAAVPIVALLMSRQRGLARAARPNADRTDLTLGMILRDRIFLTLAASFFLIPLCLAGFHLHLLAYLGDVGVGAATAGLIAGTAGVVQILSRVVCGWLVDHFYAPYVATAVMLTASAGIACLALLGAPATLLGPVAFGLAMGAEIDLLGYMTARFFPMHSYGRIYGLLYAITLSGAAISPVLYGAVFDATKGYVFAFRAAAGGLFASALLFLTLARCDNRSRC